MIVDIVSRNWREKKIRDWLLLLLRYAITCEAADRSAAQTFAHELDCVGLSSAAPSFFRRATQEICAALLTADRPQQAEVLRKHISRISDPRLQRAFIAAAGLESSNSEPKSPSRGKRKKPDLWRGLACK